MNNSVEMYRMLKWGMKDVIFSNNKIILAIPLPRFERASSGLPFAYRRIVVIFLICSKMATDLLENFKTKNLQF